MSDSNETMADALELLLLNQHAIAAGLEEVALWIEARGSLDTHDNIHHRAGNVRFECRRDNHSYREPASRPSVATNQMARCKKPHRSGV